MILKPKALSQSEQQEIQKLLGGTALKNLKRVVLSKRDSFLISSAEDSIIARRDTPREMEARKSLDRAARYQTFMEVLAELEDCDRRNEPFTVIEITPTQAGEIAV